ncbi:MAG: xylulokinase [Actinomycetota bacterium]|nr:xylulokinase [Actinomycetota bacterium]
MPGALAVGLDVGTTGVKALAVTADGTVVARAESQYGLSQPRPGWSEQAPEDWWVGSEEAITALGSHEIAGIGLSGQMHGLVTLDQRERVLRPAILWNDQRTAAECTEIEERVGLERLISLTGNRALTGFTAPKLLWLRKHEPEVYARIRHVLLPKDYVRLRLCGERAIDVADASGTLLFDVAQRRFSPAVLQSLELPEAWMPRSLESAEISGRTAAGVPVAAGAGDCAAAALGVGVERPGPVSLVLGTSGVVFAALPAYQPDPQARVHVFCHAVPGTWHAMGVMLSAAGSLQWARDTFAPGMTFERLMAEAEAAPAGAGGILFLPYLSGERTPHADPDARGALVGLSASHTRGDVMRAVLEGVAFGLADSFDLLRALGCETTVARASGGGARSDFWLRICASVLGVPVCRMSVDEGSAFGAAMLGGVAGGLFADLDQAVAACVRVRDQIDPEAAWLDLYAERRERFRALYPALKEVLG